MSASDHQPRPEQTEDSLGLKTKLFFGAGSVALGVKESGLQLLLILYYGQVLGLPEGWIGAALMLALLVDGVTDPLVGSLSDRSVSRWGRRHPFMYASALPSAVAYYFLWNPPHGLSPAALLAYLLCLVIAVRVFTTFNEIPSSALTAELTSDYHGRTALLSYRFFSGWAGGLTMSIFTFSVLLAREGGVLSARGYESYGLVSATVILFSITLSALGTHHLIPRLRGVRPVKPTQKRSSARTMRPSTRRMVADFWLLLTCPTLRPLLLSTVLGMTAVGLAQGLDMYLGAYFWRLSPQQMALFPLTFLGAVLLAFLSTRPISQRLGKRTAAQLTILAGTLTGTAPLVLALLGAFPARGSGLYVPCLLAAGGLSITCRVATGILCSSMLTDVVEARELQTGQREEGALTASGTFVGKSMSGVGVFLSGMLLTWVRFPRHAPVDAVSGDVLRDLVGMFLLITIGLSLASLWALGRFPVQRQQHEKNLELLTLQRLGLRSPARTGK